ncbi:two component sensor histidine kinase [Crocosphaera subtropica ATCC 51142]|uniref:histidine kinase n=1 Tax=Crocosphaera subtropica (strain ATCC 51142 / BH68) TaxID=43989 RepID=B1WYM7_CROS5|nr:two-component system sensor histidine kinase RppB [Crocosphaera subtropica]ACB51044.1 two component sensor histidine kinase [Crocosphaera subtropica ATCC 51142]
MLFKTDDSKLFKQTKLRLASWYIGGISLILAIIGFGVYEAIIHAHRITVEKELKTVAGTLHDNFEIILDTPGKLSDDVEQFFPNLCLVNSSCPSLDNISTYRIGTIDNGQYYLQIFDLSHHLIAYSRNYPKGLSVKKQPDQQIIIKDNQGIRYLQKSYLLHTNNGENWGYLQVARSLEDFDNYLKIVAFILLLGLPLTIILIGVSAWILTGIAMKPVANSYHQIQQFTADAAHELRTPLAAILATIESTLMISFLTENESRNTLETLGRQTQRLSRLVADLLMLSRLDWQLNMTTNHSLKQEIICLNDLIDDLLEEIAYLAVSSKITVTSQINVKSSLEIKGNTEQIYRLLFNLVINAIQYTPTGGKVKIILEQHNKCAIIQIQDTGIGIDNKELPYIFERFYRIDKARSREQGGSGLGLSIAKAIVTAHHGTIQVKSTVRKGSIFTIQLPLLGQF